LPTGDGRKKQEKGEIDRLKDKKKERKKEREGEVERKGGILEEGLS